MQTLFITVIKHDFSCINIHLVPRKVLKERAKPLGPAECYCIKTQYLIAIIAYTKKNLQQNLQKIWHIILSPFHYQHMVGHFCEYPPSRAKPIPVYADKSSLQISLLKNSVACI